MRGGPKVSMSGVFWLCFGLPPGSLLAMGNPPFSGPIVGLVECASARWRRTSFELLGQGNGR